MHTGLRAMDQRIIPSWARGACWGVNVYSPTNPRRCANQIHADFLRKFDQRVGLGEFPWGRPRRGDTTPTSVTFDKKEMERIIGALNDGPDLASTIARLEFRDLLPRGSKISWNRVSPEPMVSRHESWQRIDDAFESFERASYELARTDEKVAAMISAGVSFADPRMEQCYMHPVSSHFTVRRPDLHYQGENRVFASENDEMPGGIAELVHLDQVYGTNQWRWEKAFRWLFEEGPVLFVVSSEWSNVYFAELKWLVLGLRKAGYEAYFAAGNELAELEIGTTIRWAGNRIGTIWRQFPIFETSGPLAELVMAAAVGRVRMVPEFAHYGNKAWFSVFRRYHHWFSEHLDPKTLAILDAVLPDSHLVRGADDFPLTIGDMAIRTLASLRELDAGERNELVLKVCGANELSARSRGVLMDEDMPQQKWARWIDERIRASEPFIVQHRLSTAVVELPVRHLDARGNALNAIFKSRILVRPWSLGGEVVSAHAVAAPHTTRKVHGMVDMAVVPVDFGGVS